MNRYTPRALLDLDGVLADFDKAVYETIRGVPQGVTTKWNSIEPHEWSRMGESFWAGLDRTPEFDLILNTVEETFGAENVCLLTSPCNTPGCVEGKLRWIRRHLPAYSRRFLIGPAKAFCASPASVLIDDAEHNCTEFRKAGGDAILVPRPWNSLGNKSTVDTAMNALRTFYKQEAQI